MFALISPKCNKETRTLELLIKNLRLIVHFFVEILNIFDLIKAFDILFILLVNQMSKHQDLSVSTDQFEKW